MSKINETIFNIEQKWDIDLLFSITEKYNGVCLFTSVDDENYGKNIVGINPVLKINSIEQIDKLLELNRSDSDLPLMLGYVAYDFKDEIEEKGLYSDLHERIFPDIHFSVFEYYLIADNSNRDNLKAVKLVFPFEYNKIDISEILKADPVIHNEGHSKYLGSSLTKAEYEDGVKTIKEYIRAGDIYQANLTRKISGTTSFSPIELAVRLKNSNAIEFGVFAKIVDKYIISTTPERFCKIEDAVLITEPVKGTIQRSNDKIKDSDNLNNLLNCKKNLAELAMIVDLLRNDMNKICLNVTVNGFPIVMKLKNVYHLYSTIEGNLQTSNFVEILSALFPGGSITGCPKIRACQVIEELEKSGRGPYTGNFGYINFNGNMDFNIMIRTLFYDKGNISFNVGGGITLLSDSEDEYKETIYKAMNIYDAVNMEDIWEERYCLTGK